METNPMDYVGLDKAGAQRKHAIKRAKMHYGMWLTDEDYEALCKRIQNRKSNKTRFLKRQSIRVAVYSMAYKGRELIALYDTTRHTIITFLPAHIEAVQSTHWKPPKDSNELERRLMIPACPKCGGFGMPVKWFSGEEWSDFRCYNCSERWAELVKWDSHAEEQLKKCV